MINLSEIIDPQQDRWDGHVHLFNHEFNIHNVYPTSKFSNMVGFMDLEYDAEWDEVKSYHEYIKNYYDKDSTILLATGKTIDAIKSIYNKHKKHIKGFGELKCYDIYNGKKVDMKKITFVDQVCKFSTECGNLPVYIHWDYNKKDTHKFIKILTKYRSLPIVWCHCGMNEENRTDAYFQACALQKIYSNLWLDISYNAMKYISHNPMVIDEMDHSRVILGTDYNNKIFGVNHTAAEIDGVLNDFEKVEKYFGRAKNKRNIQKLFNLG